ncbi:hypothetical protein GCM10007854_05810 [Algimonas porphyrae]|uniref:Uncharacterized protein n=1 Tax=Algimonas porphyrae TaxID=1128113 RepID=A0ABQ5UZ31_9PROT|nr:hypothetical protein GCM10007854_05810 [Algimonas porphyrae]
MAGETNQAPRAGSVLRRNGTLKSPPVTGQSPRLVSLLMMRVQIKSDAGDRPRLEKGACLQTDPSKPPSPVMNAGDNEWGGAETMDCGPSRQIPA